MTALSDCVGDATAFFAEHYGVEPLYRRAERTQLFSLDDADEVINSRGLRRPWVRLICDGEPVAASEWTRTARSGSARIDDLLHPGRTLDQFADGATIVFQSLHRWWPALQRFCGDLESDLGQPIQANAYLTPASSSGLAPHHDTHDVFVLQTHGTKSWTVCEPLTQAPLPHQTSDHDEAGRQPVHMNVELAEGDVLYLPRGWIHSARSAEGVSLHVTVGVLATTVLDLLKRALDDAADELTSLRRTVPAHDSDAETAVASALADATDDLTKWLHERDPRSMARTHLQRVANRRGRSGSGRLAQLDRLHLIDLDTRLRPLEDADPRLTAADGRGVLELADRTIEFPVSVNEAVAELLSGQISQAVQLLDRFDQASALTLVRRLVREGLLEAVHDG